MRTLSGAVPPDGRSWVDDLYDLAIVGAGPAGSAAALRALAVRPDLRVLLMDRAAFPRDKVCGDGLGPETVALLEDLGVRDVLEGAASFDRLEVTGPGGTLVVGRVPDPGSVLPRAVLDARLVAAAVERGATLHRERITHLEVRGRLVVLNRHVAARVVVGADGANSVVRRHVRAPDRRGQHLGVAVRGYVDLPAPSPALRFRFPTEPWPAYAWSFPGPQRRANVGLVVFDGETAPTRHRLSESLSELLVGVQSVPDAIRGHRLPFSTARLPAAAGRVLLAGDAAALVNPLSGEGIATAVLSGALAGDSAARHPEAAGAVYRAGLQRRLRRHLRHVRLAARLYRSPALVERVLTAAGHSDRVFANLVALMVGTGHVSPAALLRMVRHLPVAATARAGGA